jgi:glycerol-3-phosphate cytidylyltransferase
MALADRGGRVTTVITYGTFDLFHVGHVNLLRRLRALGDRLVVGCSTDEFNAVKGKKTVMPYVHRATILSSIRYVDKVFPEQDWAQKRDDIRREGAAIFAMGEDWAGKFDDLADACEVVYLPRTQDVSTTEIRQWVNAMHAERIDELRRALERVDAIARQL